MCHQLNGRICAGWVGCHDGTHLLALRLACLGGTLTAEQIQEIRNYVSPVPLFRSGTEAAEHGLSKVNNPDERARETIAKISRRRRRVWTARRRRT